MAEQAKGSIANDPKKMEKGEELMHYFSRIDKIAGVLASLGVVKSVEDVNRKTIMTLTSGYEKRERLILYREGITRAEIEHHPTAALAPSHAEGQGRGPGSIFELVCLWW